MLFQNDSRFNSHTSADRLIDLLIQSSIGHLLAGLVTSMKIKVTTVVHLLLLAPLAADCQQTKQLRRGLTDQENGKSVADGEKRRFLKKKGAGKKPEKEKKRVVVRYKSSGGKVALLQGKERKVYHDGTS